MDANCQSVLRAPEVCPPTCRVYGTTNTNQQIKLFDADYKNEITQVKPGQTITIELKAVLNQDWNKADKGWVEISNGKSSAQKFEVIETGPNTGIFTEKYQIPEVKNSDDLVVSYGYIGFTEIASVKIAK